jgi:hypothetical protein
MNNWPVAAAMAMLILFAILTQTTTIINASHSPSFGQAKANLPCCETGVGAKFGIDCGPAVCGFGVITGSGK